MQNLLRRIKDGLGLGHPSDPHERALWIWSNVENMDLFLQQIYVYYVGGGIVPISLQRCAGVLTFAWVVYFSTFLVGCIDYSRIKHVNTLSDVIVDHCVARFSTLTIIILSSLIGVLCYRVARLTVGFGHLLQMRSFYTHVLGIRDSDIATVPWHVIVSRLTELRLENPMGAQLDMSFSSNEHESESGIGAQHDTSSSFSSDQGGIMPHPMDALDVANRIMREDNYLIALFNSDLVNLSIPRITWSRVVKWVLSETTPEKSRKPQNGPIHLDPEQGDVEVQQDPIDQDTSAVPIELTQVLEWNIIFCITRTLFGPQGQIRDEVLNDDSFEYFSKALRRRFVVMAAVNAVLAPFIVIYLAIYSFFKYFELYHKNPSSIGSRQFTPMAMWKFREFNELPHLARQRINRAHEPALEYTQQFPKKSIAVVSSLVSFIAGSIAAVLILFSILDPDAFLNFHITQGHSVIFYVGVTGSVLAISRGLVPDEHRVVDPIALMQEIIQHTHYYPSAWHGELHSAEVHSEFSNLFRMRLAVFFSEIISVFLCPIVLYKTLSPISDRFVAFFKEETVHLDGLGHVCSFAVFRPVSKHVNESVLNDRQDEEPSHNEVEQDSSSSSESSASSQIHHDSVKSNEVADPHNPFPLESSRPLNVDTMDNTNPFADMRSSVHSKSSDQQPFTVDHTRNATPTSPAANFFSASHPSAFKAANDKLHKSYVNFKLNNPLWAPQAERNDILSESLDAPDPGPSSWKPVYDYGPGGPRS